MSVRYKMHAIDAVDEQGEQLAAQFLRNILHATHRFVDQIQNLTGEWVELATPFGEFYATPSTFKQLDLTKNDRRLQRLGMQRGKFRSRTGRGRNTKRSLHITPRFENLEDSRLLATQVFTPTPVVATADDDRVEFDVVYTALDNGNMCPLSENIAKMSRKKIRHIKKTPIPLAVDEH